MTFISICNKIMSQRNRLFSGLSQSLTSYLMNRNDSTDIINRQ